MDFDTWTTRSVDRERRRRLLVGYSFGLVATGAFVTALAMTSEAQEFVEEEENILDVQLAEEPEPEVESEPEPEVEPEPDPAPSSAPPQQPMLPQMTAPDEIPDDAPEEKEAVAENPYANSDPSAYGVGQRGAAPRVVKKVIQAAPAPKPTVRKSVGPVRVTADTVPPKILSSPKAVFPESARASGIQGTVFVRFVVDRSGNATSVRAVRGPAALHSSCEAKVRATKFSPATSKSTGQVISVHRIQKCVYRLTTG